MVVVALAMAMTNERRIFKRNMEKDDTPPKGKQKKVQCIKGKCNKKRLRWTMMCLYLLLLFEHHDIQKYKIMMI